MAQETTTTIEGQGKTCQEARNDALRNAVNKAAGSVIYSKTEIANDALISDEITMLTSGNILHYDEIKTCSEINGYKTVTLRVTVSQTELKKFIEGKGKSVAISGELLKQKSDQEVASEKAELGIIKNLLIQLEAFTRDPFDYEISIGHVTIKDSKYCDLPADITIKTNLNFHNAYLKLSKELEKLSITPTDQNFRINTLGQANYAITINSTSYYFRDPNSTDLLKSFYKKFFAKLDQYTVVDDCLKELYMKEKSNELQLTADLFFPTPGYKAKTVSGNFTATIEEIGSLNRINIFASSKLADYKKGRSLSGDLALMEYSETNPLEYQSIRSNLISTFESLAKENEKGKLKLNYNIQFSKDGINNSLITDLKISQKNYQQVIELGLSKTKLNPSKLCGNFTKSTDNIKFDFKWDTYRSTFTHEKDKNSEYSNFFNNNSLPFGTYILTVKEKELNEILYKDVHISDYKTRGPLTAVYSVLIPGWGKRRVTYKEKKGWGVFFLVITPLAISLVSKAVSANNYSNYYAARDQTTIDNYFMKANKYNRAAINFRTIGATFYLYDIVWVFIKGSRNNAKRNKIKEEKSTGKLQVQYQPLN